MRDRIDMKAHTTRENWERPTRISRTGVGDALVIDKVHRHRRSSPMHLTTKTGLRINGANQSVLVLRDFSTSAVSRVDHPPRRSRISSYIRSIWISGKQNSRYEPVQGIRRTIIRKASFSLVFSFYRRSIRSALRNSSSFVDFAIYT